MGRAPILLQSEFPYNIGARCINKDWFSIPLELVWTIMSEQLFFIHHAFGVRVLAFTLMSNHFHLIARTPRANLDDAMEWFMRESSRSIVRAGNRINQTYGGPYFRCVLKGHHQYANAYKYLYYNPVKAGICTNVLDYPYSTLSGLLGIHRLAIPIENDSLLFDDVDGTLQWLNTKPDDENWSALGRALRRKEYKLARQNGRMHELEFDML